MKYCLKAIDIVSVYKTISVSAEKYMCANQQTPKHTCVHPDICVHTHLNKQVSTCI